MPSRNSAENPWQSPPEPGWRVLHVVSNHEKRVAQHLRVRSVEHFLPVYEERSQWTDRTVKVQRPLFPGYLFTRFTSEMRTRVLTTPGVVNVLGDERTGIVSPIEVELIRTALAQGYPLRPHVDLVRGTLVRVCSGIFAGVEVIITDLRRDCRVLISVSNTNQWFSLEVRREDIEVLDPAPVVAKRALMQSS